MKYHTHYNVAADPVPVERYVSPEYFEKERERIFKRKWLNVGRVNRIPKPGDYFVKDVRIANTSLLIVHGLDGEIRAFHNMCSHRGNPISWDEDGRCAGKLGRIACRFHGWAFDTKGALVHISDKQNFNDINRQDNGLTPVHCAAWEGFIFINFAQTPDQTLAEFLEPVASQMEGYPFDAFEHGYAYRIDERVNWKTLQEAQLEGWHLPYLHPKTLYLAIAQDRENMRAASLEMLGPHGLVSAAPPKTFNPSPVGKLAGQFGVGTFDSFTKSVDRSNAGPNWRGAFDFWFIFPNTFIGLLQGNYVTFNIWPISHDHSIWEINHYNPPVETAGQAFAREYGQIGFRDPMMEDCMTHEKINSVLGSGAKDHLYFQDEELICRHLSDTADRCVQGLE